VAAAANGGGSGDYYRLLKSSLCPNYLGLSHSHYISGIHSSCFNTLLFDCTCCQCSIICVTVVTSQLSV